MGSLKNSDAVDLNCFLHRENKMRQDSQLVANIRFAPFVHWLAKDQQIALEKRLSSLFLSAIEPAVMLHQFPRGKYEISALVMDIPHEQMDGLIGDCLAASIMCANLALINAGVQMYDMLVGLNLDLEQIDADYKGHMCVAVLPQLGQFSMIYSVNSHLQDKTNLKQILELAMQKCINLSRVVRSNLCAQAEKIND